MNRTPVAVIVSVAGLCCAVAGCSTRTDVSVTGNTPAQYSHVWITAQEVWFNTSAIAGPDDGGWVKFPLSTPATVDLVTESGGNLGTLVTSLNLAPGSYSQVRLIPVDATAPLTSSAQTAGALYNTEADFVDSAGTTQQLRVELLNPDKGIGIPGTLKVPVGNIGAALTATTGTTSTTGTTGTTTPTTTVTPTTTTTTTTFAITLDGARDLMPFAYTYGSTNAPSTSNGILLSSHASAYDLSQAGAITGTLTLTNISGASGLPPMQASAQVLSADGTRHVVVSSTPVHSDGTFTLYPLAANSSNAVDYDVVIHGPGIATIIIKAVQVTLTGSTSSSTPATSTTGTTGTPSLNSVSLGTLIPRAANSYTANFVNSPAPLPAGAQVSFYQTIPAAGEVPYVIETSPIDPFNQTLAHDQGLSEQTIDSGTWASSGSSITVVSAAPLEKAGTYIVAASAPSFSDGALTTTVSEPAATGTTSTTPPPVSIPPVAALALAAGSSAGTISASVAPAAAQKYQHGELLVSHDGALVAAAPLDAALGTSGGATITVSGVPSGTSSALYYLSVRVWDSSGNVQRQSYPTAIDLRGSATGALPLTIN